MKKIFNMFALAAVMFGSLPAMADGQLTDYTVDPTPGSVPELTVITLTFPNCYESEVSSRSGITVEKDGTKIGSEARYNDGQNEVIITLNERQTAAGTYTVNIEEGSITCYRDASYADSEGVPASSFDYVIESAEDGKFKFDAVPDNEEVVTELSTITLNFPAWEMMDVPVTDDVTLKRDGIAVPIRIAADYFAPKITVTLETPSTTPGTYVLTFPAGSVEGYGNGGEEYGISQSDIILTYTIEGEAPVALDFNYTASPVDGTVAGNIEKVEITFDKLDTVAFTGNAEVKSGDTTVESLFRASENVLTVASLDALSEGPLTINIPAGSLTGTKGSDSATNTEAISLSYTIASPVVYEYTATLSGATKLNADGELSDEKQIDAFFFNCPTKGLVVSAGETSVMNVRIKGLDVDFEGQASLTNGFGLSGSTFMASLPKPKYNGEYVVTIDKGSFGDEVWARNNNFGKSNEPIEIKFKFVDAKDPVVYDLEVKYITPEAGTYSKASELTKFTISFGEGVETAPRAAATLSCDQAVYSVTADFVKEGDGVYSVTFPAGTEDGTYVLTIEKGLFGDVDFISTQGKQGRANDTLSYSYILNTSVGIEAIEAEAAKSGVYSIDGVRVAESLRNLPAGIYVVAGKKVLVK